MDAPREEHAAQCASANSDTPNVCEAAEEEGVYGPWMVVKRRFSGRKGTKPNPSTEGTAIPVRNPSPHLSPRNPERMGTSPSGPVFSQSTPRVGGKQGYGDHVRKGVAG